MRLALVFNALSVSIRALRANPWPLFLNLEFQFHPVVRQPHIVGQCSIRGFVRQVVAYMGEKRTPRFYTLHDVQRVLHRRVRRVRLVAQRVQERTSKSRNWANDVSGISLKSVR